MTVHLAPTADHLAYWTREDQPTPPAVFVIGGPEEGPDVIPCPTVVTVDRVEGVEGYIRSFHVPIALDPDELAALASGGTLWLTTFGSLPIHRLDVQLVAPTREAVVEHVTGHLMVTLDLGADLAHAAAAASVEVLAAAGLCKVANTAPGQEP